MLAGLPYAGSLTVGEIPMPVHRLRAAARGAWDPAVPLVGWAFPAFLQDALAHIAIVALDGDNGPVPDRMVREADGGTGVRDAFETVLDLGDANTEPSLLRIVEAPGIIDAFWLAGAHDTFVDLAAARVMSGPEFVALIAPVDPYADALRAIAAEGEGGAAAED
jgi:hypothetical protein